MPNPEAESIIGPISKHPCSAPYHMLHSFPLLTP